MFPRAGKLLSSTAFSSHRAQPIPEFVADNKIVAVRADVDRAMRRQLVELAELESPSIAHDIRVILQRGPSKGGAKEAQQHYGDRLHETLLVTVPLVEWLEKMIPGIKRWFEVTGFGNDIAMVKVFVDWARERQT
jgi:hypothetical protein